MNREAKAHFWRNLLLGAGTMLLLGLLWLSVGSSPQALAQVPDSGAQRLEMIKELRESNLKLAEIIGLLREIRDDARRQRPATQPGLPPHRP